MTGGSPLGSTSSGGWTRPSDSVQPSAVRTVWRSTGSSFMSLRHLVVTGECSIAAASLVRSFMVRARLECVSCAGSD